MAELSIDPSTERVSANVLKHGDEYRWVHEVNLWKDTLIPLAVLKIVIGCSLVPALLMLLLSVVEGNAAEGLRIFAWVFGVTAGVMLGLFVIGYPFILLIKGGRYSVLFELDDKGINHIEMPSTAKRSELMSWVGFVVGAAAGNPTVMGANLLSASKKQLYSAFRKVQKVVVFERKHVVKLICSDMTRNLVYASPADFDLVKRLVLERCNKDVVVRTK